MMKLTGTFQITDWQESIEQEFDEGSRLSVAVVKQTYAGDVIGSSSVRYCLYYDKTGNALFNGFETLYWLQNNKQVLLTIKHDGTFDNGVASSNFTVIDSPDDSTLVGKIGSFTAIEGGQASYQIG